MYRNFCFIAVLACTQKSVEMLSVGTWNITASSNPLVPPNTYVHIQSQGMFVTEPSSLSGSYTVNPPFLKIRVWDRIPMSLQIVDCKGMDKVCLKQGPLFYTLERL